MRYRLRTLLGLMAIVAAVCAWLVPPLTRGRAAFLIESDTPGTMVFSGDRYLGETPLWLYAADFPGYEPRENFQGCWNMSAQGVGLWDDKLDRPLRAFWFRAPDAEAHKFVRYTTPFGEGTRTDGQPNWSGGSGGHDWLGRGKSHFGYQVHFQKVSLNEGLLIEVSVPQTMPTDTAVVPVSVRLRNPTNTTWRAVDDPHYGNVIYHGYGSEHGWSEWVRLQDEATQLDPGEVYEVAIDLKRTRLDRPWWVVFADIRYRPAGTPVNERREWEAFERCSHGALVRFED